MPGVSRYMERFWYRKVFDLPKHWEGARILLNFGAVDWQCQVYVNGQDMGMHIGGYDKVICFSHTTPSPERYL